MKFTHGLALNSLLLLASHSGNVQALSINLQGRATLSNRLPVFASRMKSSDKVWYTSKMRMSSATKEETNEISTEEDLTVSCIAEACVVEEEIITAKPVDKEKKEDKRRPEKIVGLSFFFVLDYVMRKIFAARGISFPSMMGGCVFLFSFLVLSELVWTGSGDSIFEKLQPSANLLAKWMPVFFVPGLAMLPTAPKIGSAVDVAKVFSLVIGGFFFTLLSTAYSVFGLRSLQGKIAKSTQDSGSTVEKKTIWIKPHSDLTLRNLLSGSVVFGGLSIFLDKIGHPLLTPINTLFMLCTTVGAYVFGGNLSPKITAVVHPIVVSTSAAWMATNLFALISGSSFLAVLKTFRAGSLSPMVAGAGDFLLYMLGPAVCSLSIAMYSRKKLMKENLPAVLLAMFVSSFGGIFSSAVYVKIMSFPGEILRLSVLTRNVTTALTIALTQILGGNTSIAASVVVMTGIFGATIGARFLNFLGLKDPVSRGLGMGAAAQGIGVASLLKEKDAMPFAAINMILTAFCSSVLISIPAVREMLKTIALGGV